MHSFCSQTHVDSVGRVRTQVRENEHGVHTGVACGRTRASVTNRQDALEHRVRHLCTATGAAPELQCRIHVTLVEVGRGRDAGTQGQRVHGGAG